MQKYVSPEMEVVEFENEDILTSSTCNPHIWCSEHICESEACSPIEYDM